MIDLHGIGQYVSVPISWLMIVYLYLKILSIGSAGCVLCQCYSFPVGGGVLL